VHLSGLRILAPHLTAANSDELLTESIGKSKRQIEEIVARHAPRPAVPEVIRKLPVHAPTETELAPGRVADGVSEPNLPAAPAPLATFALDVSAPPKAHTIAPLSAEQYKVQFTASRTLRDKIAEAKELLRHQIPDGDLAKILDRALTALIRETKKERFAIGAQARREKPSGSAGPVSRHIPNAVKRCVYERDGGRCTYVDAEGRRCASRSFLEFDHRDGFALHRSHTVEGIRLRCRSHNQHAADALYGKTFMQRFRVPGGRRIDATRQALQRVRRDK
jgi:hypothetical protein